MPFRFMTFLGGRRRPLLIGLLMASVSVLPVHAFENVRREAQHFFECLGLMIGNPPVHAQNCLPNRVPGPFGSIQSPGESGDMVVVVPVVAPPVPPAAPPACVCGPCNAI